MSHTKIKKPREVYGVELDQGRAEGIAAHLRAAGRRTRVHQRTVRAEGLWRTAWVIVTDRVQEKST